MTENSTTIDAHSRRADIARADEELLAALGYKQEFQRAFSGLETFGIAFSIIGLLPSIASVLFYPLSNGGASAMVWGWAVGSFFILLVGISMAELASAAPTSGGLYFWTHSLSSPRWRNLLAWIVGYTNTVGSIASIASIDWGCAVQIMAAASIGSGETFEPTSAQTFAVYAAVVLSHAVICCLGTAVLARLQTVYVALNVLLCLAVIIALPAATPSEFKNTAAYAFGDFTNFSGWPNGFAFILSLLAPLWTICSFDSSVHISEEASNAAVAVPWAIVYAIGIAGILGWAINVSLAFCMGTDIEALMDSDQPMAQIFFNSFGQKGTLAIWAVVVIVQYMMGSSMVLAASRQTFAFSRDGALPFSGWLYRMNGFTKTPVNTVWFVCVWAVILGLLVFAGDSAINAIFSLSITALYVAYSIPIAARFLGNNTFEPGPFTMGRWSLPIGVTAVAWMTFMGIVFLFPTSPATDTADMNYTVVVEGGVMILAIIYYYFPKYGGIHWFTGPVATIKRDEGTEGSEDSGSMKKGASATTKVVTVSSEAELQNSSGVLAQDQPDAAPNAEREMVLNWDILIHIMRHTINRWDDAKHFVALMRTCRTLYNAGKPLLLRENEVTISQDWRQLAKSRALATFILDDPCRPLYLHELCIHWIYTSNMEPVEALWPWLMTVLVQASNLTSLAFGNNIESILDADTGLAEAINGLKKLKRLRLVGAGPITADFLASLDVPLSSLELDFSTEPLGRIMQVLEKWSDSLKDFSIKSWDMPVFTGAEYPHVRRLSFATKTGDTTSIGILMDTFPNMRELACEIGHSDHTVDREEERARRLTICDSGNGLTERTALDSFEVEVESAYAFALNCQVRVWRDKVRIIPTNIHMFKTVLQDIRPLEVTMDLRICDWDMMSLGRISDVLAASRVRMLQLSIYCSTSETELPPFCHTVLNGLGGPELVLLDILITHRAPVPDSDDEVEEEADEYPEYDSDSVSLFSYYSDPEEALAHSVEIAAHAEEVSAYTEKVPAHTEEVPMHSVGKCLKRLNCAVYASRCAKSCAKLEHVFFRFDGVHTDQYWRLARDTASKKIDLVAVDDDTRLKALHDTFHGYKFSSQPISFDSSYLPLKNGASHQRTPKHSSHLCFKALTQSTSSPVNHWISHAFMFPRCLPPEIWDLIIDAVAADGDAHSVRRRALKTCWLTCRAWAPKARISLYRKTFIDINHVDRFVDSLQSNPSNGILVQSLTLYGGKQKPYQLSLVPIQLPHRLPNLTNLTFYFMDFNDIHPSFLKHLVRFESCPVAAELQTSFLHTSSSRNNHSINMPADRKKSSATTSAQGRSDNFDCPQCKKRFGRGYDLARHIKIHAPNKEQLMFWCTYPGCTHGSLQKCNLETHMKRHILGPKNQVCAVENCGYKAWDVAALIKHYNTKHSHESTTENAGPAADPSMYGTSFKPNHPSVGKRELGTEFLLQQGFLSQEMVPATSTGSSSSSFSVPAAPTTSLLSGNTFAVASSSDVLFDDRIFGTSISSTTQALSNSLAANALYSESSAKYFQGAQDLPVDNHLDGIFGMQSAPGFDFQPAESQFKTFAGSSNGPALDSAFPDMFSSFGMQQFADSLYTNEIPAASSSRVQYPTTAAPAPGVYWPSQTEQPWTEALSTSFPDASLYPSGSYSDGFISDAPAEDASFFSFGGAIEDALKESSVYGLDFPPHF
ncbi:GABA-specific high-affinity permease [Steccherinum ochraceum]|uniref:GABA-specific high-affinity permease n=1 Tax=Steccherinum ochraceum TaxID=92696 RepID=A0A4R0RRU8_9APHY|nr:GABA-specific high-affinity permease [Steccherinum ochraceum]